MKTEHQLGELKKALALMLVKKTERALTLKDRQILLQAQVRNLPLSKREERKRTFKELSYVRGSLLGLHHEMSDLRWMTSPTRPWNRQERQIDENQ